MALKSKKFQQHLLTRKLAIIKVEIDKVAHLCCFVSNLIGREQKKEGEP
jgi:hypothetical protein